jgi:hypothetical protein
MMVSIKSSSDVTATDTATCNALPVPVTIGHAESTVTSLDVSGSVDASAVVRRDDGHKRAAEGFRGRITAALRAIMKS